MLEIGIAATVFLNFFTSFNVDSFTLTVREPFNGFLDFSQRKCVCELLLIWCVHGREGGPRASKSAILVLSITPARLNEGVRGDDFGHPF